MRTKIHSLSLAICCLLITACQSTAVSITRHMMNNAETQKSVQALTNYAQQHIQRPLTVKSNLAYGEGKAEKLDVIYPDNPSGTRYPALFLVHGGGWVAGNKLSMLPYAKLLAAQGFVVINIEYSLVPQHAYPRQLIQIDRAVNYIYQHANLWPIDLHNSFLSGDSAGANLVTSYAALLYSPILQHQLSLTPQLPAANLKGIVVHSGVYDLATLYQSAQQIMWPARWIVRGLIDAYSGESPSSLRTLNTMSARPWLTRSYPPVWLSATNNDRLTYQQSRPFVGRLRKLHVPVSATIYPSTWSEPLQHDFQFTMKYRASQQVFSQSVEFMKQHVTRPK